MSVKTSFDLFGEKKKHTNTHTKNTKKTEIENNS